MSVKLFVYPDLSIQTYLIQDEATKDCVVIDPPRIVQEIQDYIDANGLKLKAVLETHVHADFISGALELKHAYQGAPLIYCSSAGGVEWIPKYADRTVGNGDAISVGALLLKARHTPGHTPEHISWLYFDKKHGDQIPLAAFTGDFLFVEGVGRPDLLGQESTENLLHEIYKSLFNRIADLPDSVHILPAHGAGSLCSKASTNQLSSTLGDERKRNSAFEPVSDMHTWMANILADLPAAPPTFFRNKKKNLEGAPLLSDLPEVNINPKTLHFKRSAIFDFREPRAFGKGHLQGSVNVPISPSLGNWLAAVLPESMPLLCIVPHDQDCQRIVNLIRLLGADQRITCAGWDTIHQRKDLVPLESISAEALFHTLQNNRSKHNYIVDVRTPTEWKAGHIKQAHHIELNQLQEKMTEIPHDKNIIALCGSGWRSSIAASLFQREGYDQVCHLAGGMKAWILGGFPVDTVS